MRISSDRARRICDLVFVDRMGAPPRVAEAAADVLVDANLRGIDSHGISVLPYYLEKFLAGQIVPDAEPVAVHDSASTVVLDAQQGVGHYSSQVAMQTAIRRAQFSGVAVVVTHHSTHNGALSYYAIQAAQQGMIGLAATACAPHVAPHGGTAGLHGTNPIAYAFPRGDDRAPLVFDLSTGHSSGKLKAHAEEAGQLPPASFLKADGSPTTDPRDLASGWILPVAGPLGYGLGLLVDGLTCGLSGGPIGREIPLVDQTDGPYHGSFFAMALSPDHFAGQEVFHERINSLVEQIENHPPQDPAEPVRWPGQRGWKSHRQRKLQGIPIPEEQWEALRVELARFDVHLPPQR